MSIIRYVERPGVSLFDDWFNVGGFEGGWTGDDRVFGYLRYPPVNLWHSDESVVVDAELPGVDPGKVEISLRENELTISGERAADDAKHGGVYHRRECACGKFSRTVTLPYRGEANKVSATYKNGILRIVVPRAESDKPRRIAIEAA